MTKLKTGKLDLFGTTYSYHVAWVDEEDGDEAAQVGQDAHTASTYLRTLKDEARAQRDEDGFDAFEYSSVELAAQEWVKQNPDTARISGSGYDFDSRTAAKKFLAAMRAASKAALEEFNTGVEWPAWAKEAQAAGWKAPKGWKP